MKRSVSVVILFVAAVLVATNTATAQTNGNPPQATGSVWLDLFAGPDGVVVYPQYGWGLKTRSGDFSGYGFVETAPHEPFFTNHLVIYTPKKIQQFSVHTETGGIPLDSLGFVQVGPRLNVHETISVLKKPLHHLFITVLPHLTGIRPDNLLIAGATNRFRVAGIQMSAEGYRRFFGDDVPDYGEYWLLVHPEKTKHLSFGVFLLHHGSRKSFSAGVRLSQ